MDFLQEIINPENWKPNITAIARKLGVSQSSVSERYSRLKKKGLLKVTVEDLPLSKSKQ